MLVSLFSVFSLSSFAQPPISCIDVKILAVDHLVSIVDQESLRCFRASDEAAVRIESRNGLRTLSGSLYAEMFEKNIEDKYTPEAPETAEGKLYAYELRFQDFQDFLGELREIRKSLEISRSNSDELQKTENRMIQLGTQLRPYGIQTEFGMSCLNPNEKL